MCCIFRLNTSIYIINATVGPGGIQYLLGPSALGHLIELVGRLKRHARRGKQLFVKSFDLSFQSFTIVWTYLFVLDKRNTLWLRVRDTVRQTSRWKSAVGPGPLTSIGMSAWPYRVTTSNYTPAPSKVEWRYTGFTPMSVRPSVCRQGFRNFLKKLLDQFI